MRADPLARGFVRSMVCLFQILIPQPWGGVGQSMAVAQQKK
jgi:hypothetical protein